MTLPMDDGPPQFGVAIFNAVQLLVFYAILSYSVHKIICHRHAPHIVNRNLYVVLTDATILGQASFCMTVRWIIIALRQRHMYAWFVIFGRLSVCYGSIPLAAVNLFKIYLVVVKFRETGASVRDDWFLTRLGRKVPRWLSIEPKTTRGQNKYLLYCYGLTLSSWAVLLNIGEKVCIRLCKVEVPVQSSYWIFPILPLMSVVLPLVGAVLLEMFRLGAINESIGLLREVRDLALSAGVMFSLSSLTVVLIDFGVLGIKYAYWGDALLMAGEWCMLYVSIVRLTSPHGYGFLRADGSKRQTLPLLLQRGASKVHPIEAKLTSPPASPASVQAAMKSTANWRDERWGLIKPDLAMLQLEALASDPTALTAVLQVARGLLSEEAVRCAVATMQLRHMSLEKEARQQLRSVWAALVDQYLKEGAPYPVSIKESDRVHLCALVEKTCQRKVLFNDDCQTVNNAFFEALLQLVPYLKPVLAAHYMSMVGLSTPNSPTSQSGSNNGPEGGSSGGLQQP